MYLDRETYTRIDNSIIELLEDYNVDEYPIDLIKLTKKMNIKTIPYSKASSYGIKNPNTISDDAFADMEHATIFYNDNIMSERQRFSIAHEIGHIWLEHKSSSKETEAEADHFAAYLLAPTPIILELGLDNPKDISNLFSISYSAATNALNRTRSRKKCKVDQESFECRIVSFCTYKGGD